MGTYADLSVGDVFTSRSRAITKDEAADLVRIGGYVHPLFSDPEYARRTPLRRSPIPGEGVLHLMGGLVEQTGRFDDTVIALVGLDQVRFPAPAFGGDTLSVRVTVTAKEEKSAGTKGLMTMRWECLRGRIVVCEATALMLFSL